MRIPPRPTPIHRAGGGWECLILASSTTQDSQPLWLQLWPWPWPWLHAAGGAWERGYSARAKSRKKHMGCSPVRVWERGSVIGEVWGRPCDVERKHRGDHAEAMQLLWLQLWPWPGPKTGTPATTTAVAFPRPGDAATATAAWLSHCMLHATGWSWTQSQCTM